MFTPSPPTWSLTYQISLGYFLVSPFLLSVSSHWSCAFAHLLWLLLGAYQSHRLLGYSRTLFQLCEKCLNVILGRFAHLLGLGFGSLSMFVTIWIISFCRHNLLMTLLELGSGQCQLRQKIKFRLHFSLLISLRTLLLLTCFFCFLILVSFCLFRLIIFEEVLNILLERGWVLSFICVLQLLFLVWNCSRGRFWFWRRREILIDKRVS